MKNDIIAGFSVFLIALPLCLGIAIASNFPPISGIFTAIIGGTLASLIGSSGLTIKGPAAGLIAIVLGAVQELGQGDLILGYKLTLAVGVIAALLQILIAWMRKAVIAEVMPPSVIHGMLAAIGVIIISKQSYVLAGIKPSASGPLELLFHLPVEIAHFNPIIFAIGMLAFAIVFFWPKLKKVAFVPSSIIILPTVIFLSLYFNLSEEYTYNLLGNTYSIGPSFLINLPLNFFDAIQFPDFSQVLSPVSLKYIVMFTLIGSIESLLTVCAVDSMSATNQFSDLNKDLRALGVANLVSACIGGLPMISEIVRSKANIDYGATSAKANFFHGVFLLLAVVLFPAVLNLIPLSALAAILIFIGFRLASPKEFSHSYEVGRDQLLLFITTFVVTLASDLLIGIAAGILLKFLCHWRRGNSFKSLFSPLITTEKRGDQTLIEIEGPLTFVSYLKLKKTVEKLAKGNKKIIISFRAVTYIDHTVMKKIQTLSYEFKDVTIIIEENQQLVQFYNHPLSTRGRS
ncbi:MAG: SulP family inorganic anion transporter [Alphaproteobacteria bacterium]|nr:SulP family inorganic anion transporter [Alphaproteobacteria bacterium]